MKFSSDPDKATLPGSKVIYRVWTEDSKKASFDLITLEGEEIALGEANLFTLTKEEETTRNIVKMVRLNDDLEVSTFTKTLLESKEFMRGSVKDLPEKIFNLAEPSKHEILLSGKFFEAFQKARKTNDLPKH